MKKIVTSGPKSRKVIDVPMVEMTDDPNLIKTNYVGVCMSEHYAWSTAQEGDAFGHEPMGIVEKVGKNVSGFAVGDRVSGLWGSTLPGAGGMVEYAVADPKTEIVVKLPDNLRDVDGILEPLACLLSAVSKTRIGVPGAKVAVVGCGYMGCGAISLLKLKGAHVTAFDIRQSSLEDAKRFGADETCLVKDIPSEWFATPQAPYAGFDLVMEWGETNESLDLAINLTNMCGQLCIGAYHTGGKRLVDVQQLNFKAIDCLSTHPREKELSRQGAFNAAALLSSGQWNFKNVPTMIYPRSQFDRAQQELETKYGSYMKAAIDMTWEDGEPYLVK